MFRRFRAYVRQHHLAMVALFVALGPAAYATHHAVNSQNIIDGQVKNQDLAPDSVGTGKIKTGGVQNTDLGASSVGTGKIFDGGVQNADLGNDSVTGAKVLDASLTGADIDESNLNAATVDGSSIARFDFERTAADISNPPMLQLGGLTLTPVCQPDGDLIVKAISTANNAYMNESTGQQNSQDVDSGEWIDLTPGETQDRTGTATYSRRRPVGGGFFVTDTVTLSYAYHQGGSSGSICEIHGTAVGR